MVGTAADGDGAVGAEAVSLTADGAYAGLALSGDLGLLDADAVVFVGELAVEGRDALGVVGRAVGPGRGVGGRGCRLRRWISGAVEDG